MCVDSYLAYSVTATLEDVIVNWNYHEAVSDNFISNDSDFKFLPELTSSFLSIKDLRIMH